MPTAAILIDASAGLNHDVEGDLAAHLQPTFQVNAREFLKPGVNDATRANWLAAAGAAEVIHCIGHGQIRCTAHAKMFDTCMMKPAIGNYPWCCPDDGAREQALTRVINESDNMTSARSRLRALGENAVRQLTPADPVHPAEACLQYGTAGAAAGGHLIITRADVLALPQLPRSVVYLSCCVSGWDPQLPGAFIERGAEHVIAYRRYADDQLSVAGAIAFYSAWKGSRYALDAVPDIFRQYVMSAAGTLHPVLYSVNRGAPSVITPPDSLDEAMPLSL